MGKSKEEKENERRKNLVLAQNKQAKKKFDSILKVDERRRKKTYRKCMAVLVIAGIFFLYSEIIDSIYNSNPPARDPFVSDNVWDNNDNDIEFDDGGNIVTDKMTDADKAIVTAQMSQLLLDDAHSRGQNDIKNVEQVLSISLLPYNLREENNSDNKYLLSILFRDEKETFALNYYTGTDFSSQEESAKDYFADFARFLNFDCALSGCSKIDEVALEAKEVLGKDVLHVGKQYTGYRQSGDKYYYIPVYHSDGSVTMYSTWTSPIDAYDLDPMEEFFKQVSNPSAEKVFQSSSATQSESLQKVVKILDDCRTLGESQEQQPKQSSATKISTSDEYEI